MWFSEGVAERLLSLDLLKNQLFNLKNEDV